MWRMGLFRPSGTAPACLTRRSQFVKTKSDTTQYLLLPQKLPNYFKRVLRQKY